MHLVLIKSSIYQLLD